MINLNAISNYAIPTITAGLIAAGWNWLPTLFFSSYELPKDPPSFTKPAVWLQTAQSDCPALFDGEGNVVHYPQSHWMPGTLTDEDKKQIWQSQASIAEYLLANPDAAIFSESCARTQIKYSDEIEREARKIFPGGIPKKLSDCTEEQRQYFMEMGAEQTLYNLGKIKKIHQYVDPLTYDEFAKRLREEEAIGNVNIFSRALRPWVFGKRETALMNELRAFYNIPQNRGRKTVFVFGGGHDFSGYFKPGSYIREEFHISPTHQKMSEYPTHRIEATGTCSPPTFYQAVFPNPDSRELPEPVPRSRDAIIHPHQDAGPKRHRRYRMNDDYMPGTESTSSLSEESDDYMPSGSPLFLE